MKCNEPGFEAVAVPDGRRGLWMRTKRNDANEVTEIELAAGREGDDAGVVLREGATITSTTLRLVEECLSYLRFGAELAKSGWNAEVDTIPIPLPSDLLAEGWKEIAPLGDDRRRFECPRGVFVVRLPPRTAQEARDVRGMVKSSREVVTDE